MKHFILLLGGLAQPVGGGPVDSIRSVNLATYQSCNLREKRGVLSVFWSGRTDQPEKVVLAALEYGPYALAMTAVIALELVLIDAALLVHRSGWSWLALAVTAFSLWSVQLTSRCQARTRSLAAIHLLRRQSQ